MTDSPGISPDSARRKSGRNAFIEDMVSVQQHANDVQLLEDRCVELRTYCDDLESENIELISRNSELTEDRHNLMQKLNDISEVVNRTWS